MVWEKLLNIAIQTPSPHNVQPWKIQIVSDTEANLFVDSTRTLPKEDVTGSFIVLTMGLFIEALDILAKLFGYRLTYQLFTDIDAFAKDLVADKSERLIPFAQLSLSAGNIVDEGYSANLFTKRRTSRISLLPKPIADDELARLTKLATEHNQRLAVTTDNEQIERVLALNTTALFEDLNSPDYHDEIVQWFRYTDSQSLRHLDGLDHRCMNTSGPTYWMSAKFPWLMKMPVLSRVMANVYRNQLGTIPTLGFLSGSFWAPAEAIETGKFLMRFWLELSKYDLYIHPFGNLVTNRPIAARVAKEMNLPDIWLVFKIGYSAEPPKSRRMPLEKILVN